LFSVSQVSCRGEVPAGVENKMDEHMNAVRRVPDGIFDKGGLGVLAGNSNELQIGDIHGKWNAVEWQREPDCPVRD
jgi:hypothetical protein